MQERDPVCGMNVDVPTSYSEAVGGRTYYFCSESCRQKFDEDPEKYGAGPSPARTPRDVELEQHEPPFTTAGPFAAPKFGSAGSGGAEYELPPERHDDRKRRA